MHPASCSLIHLILGACRRGQNVQSAWPWNHTLSCVWRASRSLSPAQSAVEMLKTSQAGVRSMMCVVPEPVTKKGASSSACFAVVVHRICLLARFRTSCGSGRPMWHTTCSRWLFSASPWFVDCYGGSLAFPRGTIDLLVDCLSCERHVEAVWCGACGQTCCRPTTGGEKWWWNKGVYGCIPGEMVGRQSA